MKYFKTWIDLLEENEPASPSDSKIRADSLKIRSEFSEESIIHAAAQISFQRGGQKARDALNKLFEEPENLTSLSEHMALYHEIPRLKLSHHTLFHIQDSMDIPNVNMEELAKLIRGDLGRDAIEPNFERKLRESTQATSEFFSCDTVKMEVRYKDKETKGQSNS